MKKFLITLGALAVVSSAAIAAEEFRPTGSVKQEIRWYGDKEEVDAEGIRFTLAEGGLRFTENFYIDYRVRDYIQYKSDEGSNSKDIRTRLYYDHGYVGDTKIDWRERVEVRSTEDYNQFTYTPELDFAEYFGRSANFAVDTFKLRPSFRYKDDNNANTAYKHAGADFLSVYTVGQEIIPGELVLEFNVYTRFYEEDFASDNSKGTAKTDAEMEDSNFATDVEFYAYYTLPLTTINGVDLAFYYEFGLDPYTFYDRKIDSLEGDEGSEVVTDSYDEHWTVYNDFEIQASYQVNASTSIYGAVAMEYANNEGRDQSSDYKWQPYAYVGWRTKF